MSHKSSKNSVAPSGSGYFIVLTRLRRAHSAAASRLMSSPATVNAKSSLQNQSWPARHWLERGIAGALFLFALAAPNSIAATQTAWILGLLVWIARLAIWPRPEIHRTPIDYPMFGFFILTGVSAFLSYEPMVSIGKLRAAMLFTIVYLFAENVRSPRMLRALAIVLVASAMISVVYTFGQYAVGRGVKVYDVRPDSPLSTARLVSRRESRAVPIFNGDTLLEVDGRPLPNAEQLVAALDGSPHDRPAKIKIYRFEWMPVVEVPRGHLLPGSTAEERLGISRGTRGRDWRAAGFFGHYTTYAEALQLIASLAIGLFVTLPQKRTRSGLLLALAIAGMCGALFLTVTRASWLAFAISATVMRSLAQSPRTNSSRRLCLAFGSGRTILLPAEAQRSAFLTGAISRPPASDRLARRLSLATSSPRHLLVGVGMDSIKAHWREWGLFDQGRVPMDTCIQNYLQIALERGVPAFSCG